MKTPRDAVDPDAPPTAEELAQAFALAQVLERGATAAPPDVAQAVEAATLLRQAAQSTMPEPARVLEAALPALQARRPRRRWWLWPAIAVPAAAAVLLVAAASVTSRSQSPRMAATVEPQRASGNVTPVPLPLLRAQAEVTRSGGKALAALDAEMRQYRATFYGRKGGR